MSRSTWIRCGVLLTMLVGVVLLFGPDRVSAQDAAPAADAPQPGLVLKLFDHFVVKGGAITWFMLIPLSIATLALIIEHCFSIRMRTILPAETLNRIYADMQARRYIDVVRATAEDPSVFAAAVKAALAQASNGYAAMQRAMAETIDQRTGRLLRKIEYLNAIGNVAPMIGLFGTVYGMIGMFATIGEAGGIPEASRIAGNISIALVTTFWGLLIAIPALSVFAFFRNRIEELSAECAASTERLLEFFEPGRGGGEAAAAGERRAAAVGS